MITKLYSAAIVGVDGTEVEVEVDFRGGEERRVFVVGLPDTAVKESTQRVESAILNSGLSAGVGTYVVNLAPADIRKQGPGFDLPIALGMVASSSNFPLQARDWCIVGELALDGGIRPVQGVLPQVIEARRAGKTCVMVPTANAQEAAAVGGISVFAADSLRQAWLIISQQEPLPLPVAYLATHTATTDEVDYDEVKGQFYAKRAMEIAAAGGHNILLCGTPGAGKSMLARRLPTILPKLTAEESLETSKIHSVCGQIAREHGLLQTRPFRAPHHTISDVGLMGGGANITPGEVSLAHNGVLFLDELPEFKRSTLETLRQPLEAGNVIISRASGTMQFPCRFMLVAAMNPCPCGYMGDTRRRCKCMDLQVARYRQRISGPMLDRFDILMELPAVDPKTLSTAPPGESSASIRGRVQAARDVQAARYKGTNITCNATLGGKSIKAYCPLSTSGIEVLQTAVEQMALSARAYDRIIKVARTIADLEQATDITDAHLYEAAQYRSFEQTFIGG